MKPDLPLSRGFTLIEMVIVTVIIGIMAAVLAPFALSSLKAYDAVLSDVVVLDKLRYATERLAREIREVKYDSGTGFAFSTPVNVTGNSMQFTRTFSSYDGTSNTTSPDTLVTVGNTNSEVTLTYSLPSGVGAQVLTDELGAQGNLVFSYYQADGTTAATSNADVRYVEIALTLSHTVAGVTTTYPQRTRVELKNYSKS